MLDALRSSRWLTLALLGAAMATSLAMASPEPAVAVGYSVHCPNYTGVAPHKGRVQLSRIRGDGTTCREIRRVLKVWFKHDLRSIGRFLDRFHCDVDPPFIATPGHPGGSCESSAEVGFAFDIRHLTTGH